MKQWEIDLRAKLQVELPEGAYEISQGNLVAWTGKQRKINAEVEFVRLGTNDPRAIPKTRIPRKLKKRLKKTYATINYLKLHYELLKAISMHYPLDNLPEMPLSSLIDGNNTDPKTVYDWKVRI